MDNDDFVVGRNPNVDVDTVTKGPTETVASAGRSIISRIEVSDLVEVVRGVLVKAPERELTIPERTQLLERRIGEMEIIAGILVFVLAIIWLRR
jgi:hypothetical protein